MNFKLIILFVTLFSFSAYSDVLRELKHLQSDVLDKTKSVESLGEFFQKHDLKHLGNERKKEIYKSRRETFREFQSAYDASKKEAESFLEQKYGEYIEIAKSPFSVSDFEKRRDEALYLKLLIDKHELSSKKWRGFDLALTFLANRISFSYDQALEYYQDLSSSPFKEEFRVLIKRFLELEYKMAKGADIPDAYKPFIK